MDECPAIVMRPKKAPTPRICDTTHGAFVRLTGLDDNVYYALNKLLATSPLYLNRQQSVKLGLLRFRALRRLSILRFESGKGTDSLLATRNAWEGENPILHLF